MPDLITTVASVLTEPAKELAIPPAKVAGSHLSLKFRDKTREERKRLIMAEMDEHFELKVYQEKKEREHAAFMEKLKEYHGEIPEEHRIEPRESLIGPAIDAAEHYMGEEELRDMFAQRIASCYDGRKVGRNHPAFTAILQGLSPLDAQNLKKAYVDGRFTACFLFADGFSNDDKNQYIRAYATYGYLKYREVMKRDNRLDPWQASSANSIERAGLITVAIKDEEKIYTNDDGDNIILETKWFMLTDLGFDFCSICLPAKKEEE